MKDGRKLHKDDRDESWLAKGHDYPANFTVNICAPVIEDISDVVGVDKSRWRNVSAYYEQNGKIYSIGQQASEPIFRGRKLVLNYTDGSPCPSDSAFDSQNILNSDKAPVHDNVRNSSENVRRKSTIMSFLCDRDPMAPRAAVSFVGTMDQCTYFFEVRSPAACGGVAHAPNTGLGPGGVFGVIVLIAIAAYLIGGCAYQRTVMHQRGWRQCPNYSLWAGMFGFVSARQEGSVQEPQ
ncbi:Cation-independent mannose-6-phosphate receptor CI-MPR [Paecilomyces lecythidis]|uniref:Cation-independent mannose-6-phosphate receptor CI-MPR n=1 Tax=Paecilomyces lecythidis TaxID=3004212 RepID=A0ABR3YFX6_9EURO